VEIICHLSSTYQRCCRFLSNADLAHKAGDGLAFATIDEVTNQVVGSTRFMKASLQNKRVEIGFTFLGKSAQKTKINTEEKNLMLTHAFKTLKLNRVEFLTDYHNTASRNAILLLGAKQRAGCSRGILYALF
jgi:RimJ/RimL family protein N-acetyltransferase